jgi:hypothetical protein
VVGGQYSKTRRGLIGTDRSTREPIEEDLRRTGCRSPFSCGTLDHHGERGFYR